MSDHNVNGDKNQQATFQTGEANHPIASIGTRGHWISFIAWAGGILLFLVLIENIRVLRSMSDRAVSPVASGAVVASDIEDAVKLARQFDKKGDFDKANAYWRNALEHAPRQQLLPLLSEYAIFISQVVERREDRSDEVAYLERLMELAVLQVPAKDVAKTMELHGKSTEFLQAYWEKLEATTDNETPEDAPELDADEELSEVDLVTAAIDRSSALLDELEECVSAYVPSADGKVSELEYKILQLAGVAESSISQLWFLDREPLTGPQKAAIDGLPKRLALAIDKFDAAHDTPIAEQIDSLSKTPPTGWKDLPKHQGNIAFYTNQYAIATGLARKLRGESAQIAAQECLGRIMAGISDEKRQQMNEYQALVANCCMMAWESWEEKATGRLKTRAVHNGHPLKNVAEFIKWYVRDFSHDESVQKLSTSKDCKALCAGSDLLSVVMGKATSADTMEVDASQLKFIKLAVCGFFRIDQSLLGPETSRVFNEMYQKYYDALDKEEMKKASLWLIEEQPYKIRLEDF